MRPRERTVSAISSKLSRSTSVSRRGARRSIALVVTSLSVDASPARSRRLKGSGRIGWYSVIGEVGKSRCGCDGPGFNRFAAGPSTASAGVCCSRRRLTGRRLEESGVEEETGGGGTREFREAERTRGERRTFSNIDGWLPAFNKNSCYSLCDFIWYIIGLIYDINVFIILHFWL